MRSVAGVAVAVVTSAIAGMGFVPAAHGDEVSARQADMPSGVLLTAVRTGQARAAASEEDGEGGGGSGTGSAFATPDGAPLYVSDKDLDPARPACVDECLKTWVPLLASRDGRAFGEWTLVDRGGGQRQWAFRGRPLYSYAKDVVPVDNPSGGRGGGAAQPMASGDGMDGTWRVARSFSARTLKAPDGITATENRMAQGWVLSTSNGIALYGFSGKKAAVDALSDDWEPIIAGLAQVPIGDFSIREGAEGVRQWAYRGRLLFQYKQDTATFDLNGTGEVPGMIPLVLFQFPVPREVAVAKDLRRGGKLVEAATGKTLYARDRVAFGNAYARGRPRGNGRPVGIGIGLAGCDAPCEQAWKPLLAPKNATAFGYYDTVLRPDGSRQWRYEGYALYTNRSEPPGVVLHHLDHPDLVLNRSEADAALNKNKVYGLWWRVVLP